MTPPSHLTEADEIPESEFDLSEDVHVLIVDDSPVDRRLAGRLLEKTTRITVSYAGDGFEAIEEIRKVSPTLILSDLQMPRMNGLQLVEAVRRDFPRLPVILMTGNGSEDIAIQALQHGAASYVPKRTLAKEILPILQQVLIAAREHRQQQRLHDALTEVEYRFCVENDPSLVPQMVAFVQENLKRMRLCDQTERIRLGIALEEALLNGLYHGNLELSSQLREEGNSTFEALGRERRGLDPYRNRRLYLSVRLSMAELRFTVRDEGPGFDVSQIPDATNPEHMMRASGRGLLLIRSFMDEVQHNPIGNEITMIRRNKV